MPRSKKSELQRQVSEKVQARAAATIPIHRQSIVNLRNSIFPSTSGTMADVTNMPIRPETDQSDRRMSPCPHLPPQTGLWKTKFCVEPSGDCSTCLLGTFVPCALYGKVNWRLNRKANGEEASQHDWQTRDGCNGPCWAYWACGLIFGGPHGHGVLSGAAAGWQRSQIRGTYGIKGNVVADVVMGMFLGPCVLMQNDREFRCREAERGLENNRRRTLNEGQEMVQVQPPMHPPMVAPGLFKIRGENIQPCNASLPSQGTTSTIPSGKNQAYVRTTEHSNKGQRLPSNRMFHPESERTETAQSGKTAAQAGSKVHDQGKQRAEKAKDKKEAAGEVQSSQDTKSELVVLKKRNQGQEPVPIVVVTGPGISVKAAKHTSSDQLPDEHATEECSSPEFVDEVGTQQNHTTASAKNSLQRQEIGDGTVDQHTLDECRPAIETTSIPRAVQKHDLAECDKSPTTPPKVKETSYAHDFTPCPGTLLEYYKKGGKKAEPQNSAVHSTKSSKNNGKKAERQESASENTENAKSNKKPSNGSQEHFLEDCSKHICENCEFIGEGSLQ